MFGARQRGAGPSVAVVVTAAVLLGFVAAPESHRAVAAHRAEVVAVQLQAAVATEVSAALNTAAVAEEADGTVPVAPAQAINSPGDLVRAVATTVMTAVVWYAAFPATLPLSFVPVLLSHALRYWDTTPLDPIYAIVKSGVAFVAAPFWPFYGSNIYAAWGLVDAGWGSAAAAAREPAAASEPVTPTVAESPATAKAIPKAAAQRTGARPAMATRAVHRTAKAAAATAEQADDPALNHANRTEPPVPARKAAVRTGRSSSVVRPADPRPSA